MCGVAGVWSSPQTFDLKDVVKMGASLTRRGPDSSGEWHDPSVGIGLAHRRLSIVDLSEMDINHDKRRSSVRTDL